MIANDLLDAAIRSNIAAALSEDIGTGDITALLIPEHTHGKARVISREPMILAGRPWVDALFKALDPSVTLEWRSREGDFVGPDTPFLYLEGPARSLLTGERPALNFIQTLSATATKAHQWVAMLAGTRAALLDTRKTLPGLRIAQKYAVTIGGGKNHRLGLFDAFLIKENHIMAAGSIAAAVEMAHRIAPGKQVEVEVETFNELEQGLSCGADIIMLDNFSLAGMREAVKLTNGRAKLEASGNIGPQNLREVGLTGVDYISMGSLTKDIKAIDLSMRFLD